MTEICGAELPTESALGFVGTGGAGIGGGLDLLEGTLVGIGGGHRAATGAGGFTGTGGGGNIIAIGAGGFTGTGGGGNIIAIGAGGFSGAGGAEIAEDSIGVRE